MLITVDDLQAFTGVYDSDLQEMYVGSAIDTVKNYLGYDPEEKEYIEYADGNGKNYIYVPNMNVKSISILSVNDIEITDYVLKGNKVILKNGIFEKGLSNVEIHYVGGWSDEEIPESIRHAAVRIAGLMQSEGKNNIGLTGKSIPNEGSRTFYNFTNYNKYLLPISSYKLVR